jgi:hypothetical protein
MDEILGEKVENGWKNGSMFFVQWMKFTIIDEKLKAKDESMKRSNNTFI